MSKKVDKITCPYCGAEYVPAEIFLPVSFLGKPRAVIRDDSYKIEDISGELPDPNEKFYCEKCNNLFLIQAKVIYTTEKSGRMNPNEEVRIPRKKVIVLEEE